MTEQSEFRADFTIIQHSVEETRDMVVGKVGDPADPQFK